MEKKWRAGNINISPKERKRRKKYVRSVTMKPKPDAEKMTQAMGTPVHFYGNTHQPWTDGRW